MKKLFLWTILVSVTVFSNVCFATDVFSDHDKTVIKIGSYLNSAFARGGMLSNSLRIQLALSEATSERRRAGNNRDSVLRDSEYYLHGLYATASGDVEHTVATTGVTIYVAFKYAAYAAKDMGIDWFEKIMRSDPSKQTSEPGGIFWAYSGLCDGLKIDGDDENPGQGSHSLSLFSCGISESTIVRPHPPSDLKLNY